jgi:hypothetical protein
MTINPVLRLYFEKCWGFDSVGPIVRYNSSPFSQLAFVTCPLSSQMRRVHLHKVPSRDLRKNIHLFIRKRDARLTYPSRHEGQKINPSMTGAMIEQFALKKTTLFEEMEPQVRQVFLEMILQFFGPDQLRNFIQMEVTIHLKEFRLPVDTQVAIKCGEKFYVGAIRDISQSGCYVEVPNELHDSLGSVTLTFHLGQNELRLEAKPVWRNLNRNSKYRQGYGIKFARPIVQLQEQISDWASSSSKTRIVGVA